jgi:hypothetical protein
MYYVFQNRKVIEILYEENMNELYELAEFCETHPEIRAHKKIGLLIDSAYKSHRRLLDKNVEYQQLCSKQRDEFEETRSLLQQALSHLIDVCAEASLQEPFGDDEGRDILRSARNWLNNYAGEK